MNAPVDRLALTGAKVLGNLAEGRAKANARRKAAADELDRRVRRALDLDIMSDNPARGRAGRIAARLRVPRRTVHDSLKRLGSTDKSRPTRVYSPVRVPDYQGFP